MKYCVSLIPKLHSCLGILCALGGGGREIIPGKHDWGNIPLIESNDRLVQVMMFRCFMTASFHPLTIFTRCIGFAIIFTHTRRLRWSFI
ncbi:BnaA08g28660D [Brassica napus]|uniref:BnaA08g28660D protein n=2 Tax=Brassica TaxID=3705 RepID=A0A078FRX0_BRANA|nr:BnaA08g28660D [Brassica napus]VDD08337.1 unnamed protein product [Brassica rapa]VDD08339.1 unnamed protein product [Brassica rapa]